MLCALASDEILRHGDDECLKSRLARIALRET